MIPELKRARSEFKRGDVAFLPSTGSICFFTNDVASGKKMTPIGNLGDHIDELSKVVSGDVFSIYEEAA